MDYEEWTRERRWLNQIMERIMVPKYIVEYRVVELYEGEPPEVFGHVWLEREPSPGTRIMLHWLDGREAYEVEVVRASDFDLDVRRVDEQVACKTG